MKFIFTLLAFLPLSQLMAEQLTVADDCQQWTIVRQQGAEQTGVKIH